ncbi:MAG: sulfotransferase family protein [Pseudomonadota bacterium]
MTLQVIGTGFGRTGTDSMRKALNRLGAGPTHHMLELHHDNPVRSLWLDLINGGNPEWEDLFNGYHACVDWPSAFYWPILINRYPDAKVLLTLRSADSWWTSFRATILRYILSNADPQGFAQLLIADQVFSGRPDDRAHAIAVYKRNVDNVVATVPSDRLLIHRLGDGWAPLCQWLERPMPDGPYPSGNTTKEFISRI